MALLQASGLLSKLIDATFGPMNAAAGSAVAMIRARMGTAAPGGEKASPLRGGADAGRGGAEFEMSERQSDAGSSGSSSYTPPELVPEQDGERAAAAAAAAVAAAAPEEGEVEAKTPSLLMMR